MGVIEFMISWISTRMSFCHASISCSSSSLCMSCTEARIYVSPRIRISVPWMMICRSSSSS